MSFTYLLICGLLIFLCLSGLCGLFFYQEYVKKISCLSVSYSNFLVLIILIALRNTRLSEILLIMVTILIVFIVNLLVGITIASNISKIESRELEKE